MIKRVFAMLLTIAVILLLAGCNPKEVVQDAVKDALSNSESSVASSSAGNSTASSSSTAEGTGDAPTENPSESTSSTSSDKPTIEEFLAQYELVKGDLEPSGFIEMYAWSCEGTEATFYIEVDEGSRSEAEIEEWFIQVFDRLKAVSDDGKLYEDAALKVEAALPSSYNTFTTGKIIMFPYNGKIVTVSLAYNAGTLAMSKDEIKQKSQYEFFIAT